MEATPGLVRISIELQDGHKLQIFTKVTVN